jgi:hypothetical protein
VRILDVAGRVVRELPIACCAATPAAAATWTAHWDGRTSHGPPAVAGIYWIAVDAGRTRPAGGRIAVVR